MAADERKGRRKEMTTIKEAAELQHVQQQAAASSGVCMAFMMGRCSKLGEGHVRRHFTDDGSASLCCSQHVMGDDYHFEHWTKCCFKGKPCPYVAPLRLELRIGPADRRLGNVHHVSTRPSTRQQEAFQLDGQVRSNNAAATRPPTALP